MRKFVCIVSIIALAHSLQSAYSQRNPPNLLEYDYFKHFRFGFYVGGNFATFTSVPNPNLNPFDSLMIVEPTGRGGFDVGISISLRLGEYFDAKFVPNISMISRSMDYTLLYNGNQTWIDTRIIESINADLPLFIKLKSSRIANNVRFYVLGGGQYCFDMMSNSKKRNSYGNKILKLKPNDFQALAGAGIEFYLPYFKLSVEGKMGYGLINLLTKENTTISSSIESLYSKTFHLSIIIE
ncbi:MAG: PorT family protein [Lentimicrobiaceae bacterium]|nr:PorT family protein [Lentimicrobiaceae bacterium]